MARRSIKKQKNSMQTIFTRYMFIVAFFVVWIGIIGVRLVHLQVNQSKWLKDRAEAQRRDSTHDKPLRGSILDRSQRTLALSVETKSLFADPSEIIDVETTAYRLAQTLGQKPQEILADIRKAKENNRRFLWLARKVDDELVAKIDALQLEGLHWKEEQKRSYPHGNLASNIVGFTNIDDVGQAGIELSQEEFLRGETTKGWQVRDRLGRVYDSSDEKEAPPKDVVLTIDYSIQYKVEEALANGVNNARAKSGTAIVLDTKNSEILAMASYPTFDPNKSKDIDAEDLANKCIQNLYTPGSTFKLITYSAALEEGLIKNEQQIDVSKGFIKVADREIEDSHKAKTLTYTDAMAISSNVAAVKTGWEVGKENFYKYARKFGFGESTGIELPAEANGMMRSPETWNPDSLASMSLGYEIGVTTLQTASAFATIANDGVRIKPRIIKQIRQSDGNVIPLNEPEKIQVVTPETARSMRQMLEAVVLRGTGTRSQVNGYAVAGKTGTAHKYDAKIKGINREKFVSSFAGFAPLNNPSIVIVVVLDEPQGEYRDGGQVAAPIFQKIAEQVLPELGVPMDGTRIDSKAPFIAEDNKKHKVENITEKSKAKKDKSDDSEKTETAKKSIKPEPIKEQDESEKPDKSEKNKEKDVAKDKPAKSTKPKEETKNKSSGKEKS
ncbi:MAG: penicillin-binding protein 2 [Pyrinomonadaceae bacterium]|nr:penicillin-binding protein 2 [Pyrinomonadaceae bacterium]